ncbi:MAG: DNA polymerase IV [Candidatus Levybacteria bacterium]|nr:DNA polymerase IV [Candidatus Levybacteria bacterium]
MDNSKDKIILHIDFDSFFASVEQQYDPKLRNRPIGVTAKNGRTCIIASSREAKRLGIKTASRTYDALKICPTILFTPADFVKYWETSKKFLNICKDYSPFVEIFSIDEVFIDVTKTMHLFDGTYGIIQRIKERIEKEIGEYITASFGVSHNKLLAKLASGMNKPDGIFEINAGNLSEVYKKAKLTDVCRIGERISNRLNKLGIYNLLDLRTVSGNILREEFGNIYSQILKNIGIARDDSEVIPYTQAPAVKSVGRNYCLAQNEYDKKKILQNVYELLEEVCIKLRRLNKKARILGFSLRGNINIHGRKTYNFYFDNIKEIRPLFKELLKKDIKIFNLSASYIRQIGVWVSGLEEKGKVPLSLFDETPKRKFLDKTIDKINDKFGDHTIRNGFLLYSEKLTTVPNGYMADKYERTKLASTG